MWPRPQEIGSARAWEQFSIGAWRLKCTGAGMDRPICDPNRIGGEGTGLTLTFSWLVIIEYVFDRVCLLYVARTLFAEPISFFWRGFKGPWFS